MTQAARTAALSPDLTGLADRSLQVFLPHTCPFARWLDKGADPQGFEGLERVRAALPHSCVLPP